MVEKSNKVLFSISSVFPFNIFPNTINIEEGRITIIYRHLFSSEIHSVDIKNISNIFLNTSIFLSQLVVISKTYEENEIKLKYLITREAIYARRIMEGLRILEHEQVDTSGYTTSELLEKLEELSKTSIVM